jgi:glycosyltransferase involved in cell wall biosynthesis
VSEAEPAGRVLMVCDSLLKYTAALARGLAEAGAEVRLLGRDHGREFGGDAEEMREYVRRALGGRVEHLILPGRVREPSHWRRMVELRRTLRRFDPDVLHYQDSAVNDPRLLVAAPPRKGRTAVTVHDPVSRLENGVPLRQRAVKAGLMRRASLVFVHAEALREQMARELGAGTPLVVVPHGIVTPRVRPLPATPTVLAFGRIHPYKGLDVLFDAMPAVWEAVPECRLVIAGQGRLPQHPVLADARVEIRNEYLPEGTIPELFDDATCVALPYREASQSGVGSLAKEHGRAIVASDVGGLPELVGEAGILVPADSPPALADALTEILRTPGLAERLGRAGAASVEGSAGWMDVARATLDAYRTYLAPSRISARRAVS